MPETQQYFLINLFASCVVAMLTIATVILIRARHSRLAERVNHLASVVSDPIDGLTVQMAAMNAAVTNQSSWISRNSNMDGWLDKLSPQMTSLSVAVEKHRVDLGKVAGTLANLLLTVDTIRSEHSKLAGELAVDRSKLVGELAEIRGLAESCPPVVSMTDEEKAAIATQACQESLRRAALALMAESSAQPRRYVSTVEAVRMPVSVHKPTDVLIQQGTIPRTLQVGHANCSPEEVLELITVLSAWVCTNSIPDLKGSANESGTQEVQALPRLSQETNAFSAELWIDGKKAADASNSGTGGCDELHFSDRKLEKAFYDYCKSLPPVQSKYGPLEMNSDLFLGQLIEKLIMKKQLENWCKHSVVYRHKDTEKGSWYKSKMKFTPAVADVIRKRAGANFDLIVNEDIDKAVEVVTSMPD